ncbi:MAG: flippase-like domain-containing protein [Chitinispirillaceae bacterium]|nr:flippase-like domain-containing protein [Chitinispirillaceae bacterium]
MSRPSNRWSIIKKFGPYIITAVILAVLFWKISPKKIVDGISQADLIMGTVAFFMSVVFVLFAGIKMKIILSEMGYNISLSEAFALTIATYPLNVVIPSKGGDFAKSWFLSDKISLSEGISVVLAERIVDIAMLVAFAIVGALVAGIYELLWIAVLFVIGLTGIFIIIIKTETNKLRSRYLRKLNNLRMSLRTIFKNRRRLILVCLISMGIWVGSAVQVYVIFKALGTTVPIGYTCAATSVAIFIGFLPVTIAGMGTRDAAFVLLYSEYASEANSLAAGMLYTLFRYWGLAALGLPFLYRIHKKNQKSVNEITSKTQME